MFRRFALAAIVTSTLALGSVGSAQNSARAIPMGGTVLNAAGVPAADVVVALLRHTASARGSQGVEIVAQAHTY